MQGQSVKTAAAKAAGEDQSKRQERAHRILDAAAELMQRWGYKKTTMDDISRLAGVAKGTLYLHWRTREDLFVTLTLRESIETTRAFLERIDNDPQGLYLSHMLRHMFAIAMSRPLARAIFTQDTSVLGELLQSGREDLNFITQQKMLSSEKLFELYREKGMLRTDRSVSEQVKICMAIFIGFMSIDHYMMANFSSSPEEAADMLAEAIHRTLEPEEAVAAETLQEVQQVWDQFTAQLLQIIEERIPNGVL